MPDNTRNEVKDKFSQRFDSDQPDKNDENEKKQKKEKNGKEGKKGQIKGKDKNEKQGENVKNEQKENSGKKGSREKTVKNIKNHWSNHSFYLDDKLADDLSSEFKRLDWQLDDQHDFSIKKTRHYYPLIASLGLEQLKELDTDEIRTRIEEIDPDI